MTDVKLNLFKFQVKTRKQRKKKKQSTAPVTDLPMDVGYKPAHGAKEGDVAAEVVQSQSVKKVDTVDEPVSLLKSFFYLESWNFTYAVTSCHGEHCKIWRELLLYADTILHGNI